MSLINVGLKARNFKCFGSEPQGFDEIKPINIIIGRNNSGKSSLLDIVKYATKQEDIAHLGHKGEEPHIYVTERLTEDLIVEHLSTEPTKLVTDRQGSYINFIAQQWGRRNLKDKTALLRVSEGSKNRYSDIEVLDFDEKFSRQEDPKREWKYVKKQIKGRLSNPFQEYQFRRIVADRDIVPEASNDKLRIYPNGSGVTNTIQRFILSSVRNRTVVEEALLDNLNEILRPDADYQRLLPEELTNGEGWEIKLDEPRKRKHIPMSQTGSGLKTVLLVLSNLILLPELENSNDDRKLEKYLFGFEELENNLHPAIQRRLFLHLRKTAIREDCYFFITTHSNVVIDMFSRDEHAQILHVRHDGESATVNNVKTTFDGHSVLRDLDVRASDLLQTNAVVWVEGPSDLIYFNRWIELWTEGKLVEGIHYQCLTYGGSVNKYLTFEDPTFVNDMISAFRINPHAIMLADSDRRNEGDELKPHTRRLKEELESAETSGYTWVTKGREVENYIPPEVFSSLLGDKSAEGPKEFSDVIKYLQDKSGKKTWNKTDLAQSVGKLLTKEMVENWLDMKEQLDQVCEKLKEWNRVEEATA